MMENRLSRRDVILQAGGVAAAASMLGLVGCAREAVIRGATMGTTYRVKISDRLSGGDIRALEARIEAVLETVNEQMSTFRPESELSRFNAGGAAEWHAVSEDTVAVVEHALEVGRLSGGAFDATLGRLVHRWGFGSPIWRGLIADHGSSGELCSVTGRRSLRVRRSPAALRKSCASVLVDLSGIAKGFALDRIGARLEEHGVANYLVEIGGELRVRGRNFEGEPWRIGIEQPAADRTALQSTVHLETGALATSGDYRDYYEIAGRRYSHIIDPRTGAPVADGLASVSVIAPSTMHADAMATAMMVLGPDDGMHLAQSQGLAALFVARADGRYTELATPDFDRYRVV